ncbi:unnamed protein product [Owenia fusiformis]|nr:unnamed protein product [Owenia fusiformis]
MSIEYSVSVHNIGGNFGTWMKDEELAGSGTKVWVMHGTNNNLLDEYNSEYDFQTNNLNRTITLPYSCEGTGHTVYSNNFYCQVYASRYLGKYDLSTGMYTWVELPTLGQSLYDEYQWGYLNDVSGTAWGNGSFVDFEVDEYGLWVIHSDLSNNHNIIISRVDVNLVVIESFNTNFPKVDAGNAFMICGRLYVINSCIGEVTYIRYIYDTTDQTETNLLPTTIPFPSVQRSCSIGDTCPTYTNAFITGLDFAVAEKPDAVLYAWNCKYQEVYKPVFN